MSENPDTPRSSAVEPIVLANHPRASRHIRQAKGWGGLVCFALALFLSHRAGVPLLDAVARAVVFGLAGMLICWAAVVTLWRQLAVAEVEAARRRIRDRRAAAQAPPPEHAEANA